jgi:hypothetical protein
MLASQCRREKLPRPVYLTRWINIKKIFQEFYKRDNLLGMAGMLNVLQMELEGKHHSGIADCRNLCRILKRMLQEGCLMQITSENPLTTPKKVEPAPPVTQDNAEFVRQVEGFILEVSIEDVVRETKRELAIEGPTPEKLLGKLRGFVNRNVLEKCRVRFPKEFEALPAQDRKAITFRIAQIVNEKFVE